MMALAREELKKRCRRLLRPAILGTFRRTTPISSRWGSDRGTPLDRYYIEAFLQQHRADIKGRVMEVKDNRYTLEFGSGVDDSQVLDVDPNNPNATIVADLSKADAVAADSFDCIILTQTLNYIYDAASAVRHCHRMLKPGGVILTTVPSVSRMCGHSGHRMDYWRFTEASCKRTFGEVFGPDRISVQPRGNVLTAAAFLFGMAHEELHDRELRHDDPDFPVVVTVRAVK